MVEGDVFPDLRLPVLPPLWLPLSRIRPAWGSMLKGDYRVHLESGLAGSLALKSRGHKHVLVWVSCAMLIGSRPSRPPPVGSVVECGGTRTFKPTEKNLSAHGQ